MTTTEKILADADKLIERCEAAKRFAQFHRERLDAFGSGSSFGILSADLFLHEPPADSKDFCRTVGGDWLRSTLDGRTDYKGKVPAFEITIFGAETNSSEEVLAL